MYDIDRNKLPLHKNAVTRTADVTRPKRLYILTDGLREYLAADHRESLKVIAAGLKIFERQEHKGARRRKSHPHPATSASSRTAFT